MERSRFNYFVNRTEIRGASIAYNARTGNFTLMSNQIAEILKGEGTLTSLRCLEELCELGFLHNGDELEKISLVFLPDAMVQSQFF